MTTEFSKSTNGTKPYPHGLKMYRGAYSPNTKLYFPSNEVFFLYDRKEKIHNVFISPDSL